MNQTVTYWSLIHHPPIFSGIGTLRLYQATVHIYRWLIIVQNSEYKLSQWNRFRSYIIILSEFNHTLFVLHAMFGQANIWIHIKQYVALAIGRTGYGIPRIFFSMQIGASPNLHTECGIHCSSP